VRAVGVVLLFVGLIVSVVGFFSGCGSLFTWNGRHIIDEQVLSDTAAFSKSFTPEAGRRYTLAIQVVFDRESTPRVDGVAKPDVKMPLVARVKDPTGTKLAEVTGWVDPNEPPNVLYGQAVPDSVTASRGAQAPDLFVERLIGPFAAASDSPLTIEVNLGPDRSGAQRIVARRLVIHDDAIPPAIRNAFVLGTVGVLLFIAGIFVGLIGWWKRRKPKNPLSQKREPRRKEAAKT